jgi:hypothetical protein
LADGLLFGKPPSDRVLAPHDGAYVFGRREMFEMNLRMKEEESE